MAPPVGQSQSREPSLKQKFWKFVKTMNKNQIYRVIFDPSCMWVVAAALIVFECAVNVFIIDTVKYTEIDWKAYMQEVEGVVNGTWDYNQLQGDTGPLVYPAGFVYFFMALYYITNHGANIRLAQYLFAAFYIITLLLVFRLYQKSKKVPPYALLFLCCTSYRVHSIYVLRLFNDPIAMMFLYAALNLFLDGHWSLGSFIYSLAVSIKMNILLFAPALLLAYIHCLGVKRTLVQLSICAGVQLLLGAPFLLKNPVGYIKGSFDIGRIFLFKWTVNWRFLGEELFVNRLFHIGLLVLHILLLALFAYTHWNKYLVQYPRLLQLDIASQLFLTPLFMCNLVGVAVSRSLHYQFYVWYFHSLPYLLWSTELKVVLKVLILGLIEMCWNTYPSTNWSSAILHVCHIVILGALFHNRPSVERTEKMRQTLSKKD